MVVGATALAHSPLETSTRAIARENTFEVMLTVGMEAGAILLKDQPPEASRNRPVGAGFELPKDFAARLFEFSTNGSTLTPNKIEVRTDGLEFNFLLEFRRPQTNALAVRANYVSQLPASLKSSFILTDENGNIFFTRAVKQDDNVFDITLPPAMPGTQTVSAAPPNTAAANIIEQHFSSSAMPETKLPAAKSRSPRGAISVVIALVLLAGIGLALRQNRPK